MLLGLLLVWVAATGRYFFDRRTPAWIGLGAFLIYWGLRAWWSAGHGIARAEPLVRGGSLALVGFMMLAIAWVPFSWIGPLLGVTGGLLIVRGIASALLIARGS